MLCDLHYTYEFDLIYKTNYINECLGHEIYLATNCTSLDSTVGNVSVWIISKDKLKLDA